MKTLRWILTTAILGAAVFGFVQWRRRGEVPLQERLDQLTKAELYRRARAAGIEGRSRMNKAELVEALAACSSGTKRSTAVSCSELIADVSPPGRRLGDSTLGDRVVRR